MKRALLASLDAWQKYWGERILCLFTAGCMFCISWYSEEKKTIQNFIRLYCKFFLLCFSVR